MSAKSILVYSDRLTDRVSQRKRYASQTCSDPIIKIISKFPLIKLHFKVTIFSTAGFYTKYRIMEIKSSTNKYGDAKLISLARAGPEPVKLVSWVSECVPYTNVPTIKFSYFFIYYFGKKITFLTSIYLEFPSPYQQ